LIVTVVAAAIAVVGIVFLAWWTVFIVLVPWAALAAFFRDPIRSIPDNLPPGVMVSPADGVISAVTEVEEHPATGGPAKIVRIFLSVLDVHVNRSPYGGEVVAIAHSPGKYLNAQTEESAKVNESNLITMRIQGGETIGIRQVAGMVARRIVCGVKIGDKLTLGEKFGMIKFGSTAELILPRPDDVTVHVQKGERVRGGLTLLATLGPVGSGAEDGEHAEVEISVEPKPARQVTRADQ
jgi:phosphatidylserine decarboxylase